jgi:hypothetical protein
MRREALGMPAGAAHVVCSGSAGFSDRIVTLNSRMPKEAEQQPLMEFACEPRFGFAGPADRVMSLNIPAEAEAGRIRHGLSFDIEFDPDRADDLRICLLDHDEDGFIRTVQQSIVFPAGLLAELLSRREATPEEAAAWQTLDQG